MTDPHPFDATQAARSILAAAGMPSVAGPDLDRAAEAVRREVEVYALLLVAAQVRLVRELRGGAGAAIGLPAPAAFGERR